MCQSNTASEVCKAGMFAVDRTCPTQSFCASGYCNAPGGGAQSCQLSGGPNEQDCLGLSSTLSCQPFVDPKNPTAAGVQWFCDTEVAPCTTMPPGGCPGDACTSGAQCRSGFCGSNGTCYRACLSQADCPSTNPALKCSTVQIDVEGVMVSALSCIP
jgi:hypothetical protein